MFCYYRFCYNNKIVYIVVQHVNSWKENDFFDYWYMKAMFQKFDHEMQVMYFPYNFCLLGHWGLMYLRQIALQSCSCKHIHHFPYQFFL